MKINQILRRAAIGLALVATLGGCNQKSDDARAKNLESFTGGAQDEPCSGTFDATPYAASIDATNGLKDVALQTLAAVPQDILDAYFKDLGGRLVVTKSAAARCIGVDERGLARAVNDGAPRLVSCWQGENGKPVIYVNDDDGADVRRATLRAFAYFTVEDLLAGDPQMKSAAAAVGEALLADVAASQTMKLDSFAGQLHPYVLKRGLTDKARGERLQELVGGDRVARDLFFSFALAETFDQAYCNAKTKAQLAVGGKFARVGKAWPRAGALIEDLRAAKAGLGLTGPAAKKAKVGGTAWYFKKNVELRQKYGYQPPTFAKTYRPGGGSKTSALKNPYSAATQSRIHSVTGSSSGAFSPKAKKSSGPLDRSDYGYRAPSGASQKASGPLNRSDFGVNQGAGAKKKTSGPLNRSDFGTSQGASAKAKTSGPLNRSDFGTPSAPQNQATVGIDRSQSLREALAAEGRLGSAGDATNGQSAPALPFAIDRSKLLQESLAAESKGDAGSSFGGELAPLPAGEELHYRAPTIPDAAIATESVVDLTGTVKSEKDAWGEGELERIDVGMPQTQEAAFGDSGVQQVFGNSDAASPFGGDATASATGNDFGGGDFSDPAATTSGNDFGGGDFSDASATTSGNDFGGGDVSDGGASAAASSEMAVGNISESGGQMMAMETVMDSSAAGPSQDVAMEPTPSYTEAAAEPAPMAAPEPASFPEPMPAAEPAPAPEPEPAPAPEPEPAPAPEPEPAPAPEPEPAPAPEFEPSPSGESEG